MFTLVKCLHVSFDVGLHNENQFPHGTNAFFPRARPKEVSSIVIHKRSLDDSTFSLSVPKAENRSPIFPCRMQMIVLICFGRKKNNHNR